MNEPRFGPISPFMAGELAETKEPNMNADTVKSEVQTLTRSEAGRAAARNLLELLDGPPLDVENQYVHLRLLMAAWSAGWHGTVADELREALGISD